MIKYLAAALAVASTAVFAAPALAAPPPPTNLQIVTQTINNARHAVLTWTGVPKAASYDVVIADSTINVRDPHTVYSSDNVGLATSLDLGPVFAFGYSDCGLTSEITYSVSSEDAHGNPSDPVSVSIYPGC